MAAYPKIVSGYQPDGDNIIIQAKIDGSQCSIIRTGDSLNFYNKGSLIKGNKVFQNTLLCLSNKVDMFQEGFVYHGESVCSTRHNIAKYDRIPNYCWVIYEIIRSSDGYALDQTQMERMLQGTGIEIVDLLYCGPGNETVINEIMAAEPSTLLGGEFEGIVIKKLNGLDDAKKFSHYRRKLVAPRFREEREAVAVRDTCTDQEFLIELGGRYNVPARIHKGIQRCKEQGITDIAQNLDDDLTQEQGIHIKDALLCRMFNNMVNGARDGFLGKAQSGGFAEQLGRTFVSKDAKNVQEFIEQCKKAFSTDPSYREALWQEYKSIILVEARRVLEARRDS